MYILHTLIYICRLLGVTAVMPLGCSLGSDIKVLQSFFNKHTRTYTYSYTRACARTHARTERIFAPPLPQKHNTH